MPTGVSAQVIRTCIHLLDSAQEIRVRVMVKVRVRVRVRPAFGLSTARAPPRGANGVIGILALRNTTVVRIG